MLEQLRNNSKSGIIYFLFGIIIIVFVFTFNTSGPGGGCTGGEEWPAASVNGETIYLSDVDLAMKLSANAPANPLDSFGAAIFRGTRYARLGLTRPDLPSPYTPSETFTRAGATGPATKAQKVLDDLVETYLLAQEAERMGLRVTDAELVAAVKTWLEREQGEFSAENYSNTIRYGLGTTRQRFEGLLTRELLRTKLAQLVGSQGAVAPGDVVQATKAISEKVVVRYIKVDANAVQAGISVTDAEAAAFAKDNAEKISAAYEARNSEFNQPEKVQVSGIFKKAPFPAQIENEKDATKKAALQAERDAAKTALQTILAEVKAAAVPAPPLADGGAAERTDVFAAKAESDSDDSSKSRKGLFESALSKEELARYPYGEEVAAAAFTLEPGVISEVIEVNRGFWLIRPEKKVAPVSRPLEAVSLQIAADLLRAEKAPSVVDAVAQEVLASAKDGAGKSLTEVASGYSKAQLVAAETLPLNRLKQLGDTNGWKQVGGLGCAPEMVRAAFALSAEQPLSGEVFKIYSGPECDTDTGARVIAEFASKVEATEEEVKNTETSVRDQLEAFAAREAFRTWYNKLEKDADVSVSSEMNAYIAQDAAAAQTGLVPPGI